MTGGLMMTVLLIAGCGGGPKAPAATATHTPVAVTETAAAPTQETHAEFIRALDATCRGSVDDLVSDANAAGNDTVRLANIMHRVLGRIEPSTKARARLIPPSRDAAAYRRYQRAQARLVGVYGRLEDALRANDTEQVQYLLGLLPGIRKARTTAALDLGTKRCGG